MSVRAGLIFGIGFAALSFGAGMAADQPRIPRESDVFETLNEFRADPAGFVRVLRELRPFFVGNLLKIPGQPDLLTEEGVQPLDEAIADLQSIRAGLPRVTLSEPLSRAAADHVRDTGQLGLVGHNASDGTDFRKRIGRYGTAFAGAGEVIAYGPKEARAVIVELVIDDGVASRGHRKILLNARWNHAGIACGAHARYGTMCVIDFLN
jgi:uncharacterized protein YkwD